ncbi:MAG: hypothetical protein IH605_04950 [Burkholderiales bacterium]|nr:hypothetical protein [Burkholderiales bacterium]
MAMLERSSAVASELAAYLRTRIATPRIGLLWLVVVAAASTSGAMVEPDHGVFYAALLALLIAQFRLWDDLYDLAHDREHHAQRVLVRAAKLLPFRILLAVSFATGLGALVLVAEAERGIAYALLVAAFLTLYRVLKRRPATRLLRTQLVLLKYPAFILIVAPHPLQLRSLAAAMVLYLLLSAYDAHDRTPQ